MKSPYIKDLAPEQIAIAKYLVCAKEIRQKKHGDPYLSLLLGDRTGELDAKMWDNVADVMETFDRNDFVTVKGRYQIFHNRPQLTIHTIHRLDDSQVDFTDFFPSSTRDCEEMWRELLGHAGSITNPHLRRLIDALLDDPEIARRYRIAPAAKQIHHACLGGLLEHVLSLCRLAHVAASHYPFIDGDLLLAGVLLHDMGKIYELRYERGFSYSDEGQLLGHMMIAVRMVGDKLQSIPDFPERLRTLIEHMIISHHGSLEFGSPKLPQFPEAMLLHYLDDLDSKMETMRHLVATDRLVDGCFTGYSSSLDRCLLKKDRYLSAELSAPPKTVAPVEPLATAMAPAGPAAAPQPVTAEPARTSTPVAPPPKPASVFGDKLRQALQPVESKRNV